MANAIRFTRRDASGDSLTETLTIVKLPHAVYSEELGAETEYGVEVTEQSTGHVSIHDLDGEQISEVIEWEVPESVPPEVVAAVSDGWASGNYVVERV